MISRSWPNGFARACVTTSLLARVLAAQPAVQRPPAIALVDGADAVQWQTWTHDLGWRVIAPEAATNASIDQRVLALAAQVEAAIKSGAVDPARVYIAGRGDAAAMVFYAISRVPDLWAAGAAVGGSPKPAIDTSRIFAANFTNESGVESTIRFHKNIAGLWLLQECQRQWAERGRNYPFEALVRIAQA